MTSLFYLKTIVYNCNMKKLINQIFDFFDLHFGWFFVNGNKNKRWEGYLKQKYKK